MITGAAVLELMHRKQLVFVSHKEKIEMIEEIVNEWFKRVTEVAIPYPLGTTQYKVWKCSYDTHCTHMKELAEELREVLKTKLGPNCKNCTLHGRR
jgi:hypothetical protein